MAGRFKFVALVVVVIGLFMGVAFGLGVKYGKGKEPETTQGVTLAQIQQMIGGAGGTTAGAGGAGAAGGGAGAGGAQSGTGGNTASAASARSTAGKITAVQGQTVTIEIRPGLTQKLNLGAQSTVNKFSAGAGADLKEGSSVVVSGTRKDDGSFDVTTINLVPPELATILATNAPSGAAPTTPAAATPGAPAPAAPAATPTR